MQWAEAGFRTRFWGTSPEVRDRVIRWASEQYGYDLDEWVPITGMGRARFPGPLAQMVKAALRETKTAARSGNSHKP